MRISAICSRRRQIEPFQVLAEAKFHPKWVDNTLNTALDGGGPRR
jgi:hypothetical protein